jgi:hypothetical protein
MGLTIHTPSAVYPDLRQTGESHPLSRRRMAAYSGKDEQAGFLRFPLRKDGIPGGKGYEGKFRKPASSEAPDDVVSWQ